MKRGVARIEVQSVEPGVVILHCRGELSWEDRERLADAAARHLGRPTEHAGVILNLADLEHVNSAGLGALFQLARALRQRHAMLYLAGASPRLSHMFRTVGLHRLARVHDDVRAALADLRAGASSSPGGPQESGPRTAGSGGPDDAAGHRERRGVRRAR